MDFKKNITKLFMGGEINFPIFLLKKEDNLLSIYLYHLYLYHRRLKESPKRGILHFTLSMHSDRGIL